MPAKIILAGGQIAIVDPEDFDRLNCWRWHLNGEAKPRYRYPVRRIWRPTESSLSITMSRAILGLEGKTALVLYRIATDWTTAGRTWLSQAVTRCKATAEKSLHAPEGFRPADSRGSISTGFPANGALPSRSMARRISLVTLKQRRRPRQLTNERHRTTSEPSHFAAPTKQKGLPGRYSPRDGREGRRSDERHYTHSRGKIHGGLRC